MNEKFSDERISAYLDDELAAEERAAVERELAASAELRHAIEELRALRTGLQSLPRYRLETNIAERVLELAEREVLTRGCSGDDSKSSNATPISPPRQSIAAHREDGRSHGDHRPQPSLQSPSSTSRREGGFNWRNLVWSATAAGVAAMLTNYYHVNNRPDEITNRSSDQVAAGQNSTSRSNPQFKPAGGKLGDSADEALLADSAPTANAAREAAGGRQTPTADGARSDAALNGAATRHTGSIAERRELAQDAAAPSPPGDAGDGTGESGAGNSTFAADAATGRTFGGGNRPNADASADLAMAAGAAPAVGGVPRAQFRQQDKFAESMPLAAPVPVFVFHVSHEAMRQRTFDGVLTAHRVAMLDEGEESAGAAASSGFAEPANDAGNRDTGGRGAGRRDAGGRGDAKGDAAKSLEKQDGGASTSTAVDALTPELVEIEMTPDQLAAILAAVDRNADDFTFVGEFALEVAKDGDNGRENRSDEFADGAANEEPGVTTRTRPGGAADETPAAAAPTDDERVDSSPMPEDRPPGVPQPPAANKDEDGAAESARAPAKAEEKDADPPPAGAPPRAAPGHATEPQAKEKADGRGAPGEGENKKPANRANDRARKKEEATPKSRNLDKPSPNTIQGEADTARPSTNQPRSKPSSPVADAPTAEAPVPEAPAAGEDRAVKRGSAGDRGGIGGFRRDANAAESPAADRKAADGRSAMVESYARVVRPRLSVSRQSLSRVARGQVAPQPDAPKSEALQPDAPAHAPHLADEPSKSAVADSSAGAPRIRVYFFLQPTRDLPAATAPAEGATAPANPD